MPAYRVHYRHDNTGVINQKTGDPVKEGPVEEVDEIIADTEDEARREVTETHWNDREFEVVRVEEFDLDG